MRNPKKFKILIYKVTQICISQRKKPIREQTQCIGNGMVCYYVGVLEIKKIGKKSTIKLFEKKNEKKYNSFLIK